MFGHFPAISFEKQYDFQKNGIAYIWEKEPSHFEFKKVFLDAFIKCYDQVPLDILRKSSREEMIQWLADVFEEVCADHKSSKNSLWLSALADDKVIGFLVIDLAKYPEEIYLAQLAIDPAYQRRGIASSMIHSLFNQFSECDRFVVITRRANEEAKRFYKALNFSPSLYMHERYSPELFTGFEYINQKKLKSQFFKAPMIFSYTYSRNNPNRGSRICVVSSSNLSKFQQSPLQEPSFPVKQLVPFSVLFLLPCFSLL